ncbi:MAG TPA: AAA family ATPase [Solirubrobacteraceae bacterium]|nr:AAA family ATPase [Solirubrobacteraceae bacterium]
MVGSLAPGATIAGYRIDAVAGRGGMGTVYRATQLSLERTVALKVVAAPLFDDADARRRFEVEAKVAAMLDHPSIVAVHDAGEVDGVTFIAMRFVDGPDLRQLLLSERVEPARGVDILAQVADALDAAHAAGLVHRDVKPANILVGSGDRAFLTDFGLTRLASASDGPTGEGEWVGSPDYAAPEQIRGESVGAAADVYALGCVLFRVLAGRVPFQRDTTSARVWAHLHEAPPALSQVAPQHAAVDAVLARAMSKHPALRPASASELVEEVARALGSPLPPRPPPATVSPAVTVTPAVRRRPLAPEADPSRTDIAVPGPLAAVGHRIASRTLVGRDTELATLRAAVERASRGVPSLTIVAGEAGIGKSRLVQALTRAARATDDVLVLEGACLGLSGGDAPYAPIVAALRELAAGPHAGVLDGLAPQARAELARAVPELGAGASTAAVADEPGRYAQARLFELLLGLLRELSQQTATLLVVEDLHWADPSTLDFVRYVVAHARAERVAIVATYRSDELRRRDPRHAQLAELARDRRVQRVELARLTRAEMARQLASVLDAPPGAALADGIFSRSQGNPFFTEELLATHLAGAGDELPASLRDALLVRVDALSETAQAALRVVAVVGRAADHALLGAATERDEHELVAALREAVAAHVLVQHADRLNFRHALVREAVCADLLGGERATLHRRVAEALARTSDPTNQGELAGHWHAAGDVDRALTASVGAGLAAARTYAFRDALEHFERALELWPRADDARRGAVLDHAGLLAEAAEAARLIGEADRAVTLCGQALEAVDPIAEPQRAAHLHERLGRYLACDPQVALVSYGRALELLAPAPSALRARVLCDEGLALLYLVRLDESRRRCEDALRIAQAAAATTEEAYARSTLGLVLALLGLPVEGEAHLRAALAIVTELGRAEDVARAHINLAEVLRYRGLIVEALAVTVDGERTARRLGVESSFGAYLSINAAEDLFHLGRWGESTRRLDAIDGDGLEPSSRQLWHCVAGRLDVARGRAQAGRAHLDAARALNSVVLIPEQLPSVYAGLAELALWSGRPDDARLLVAEGIELAGDADALHLPVLLATGVRAQADAAVRLGRGERQAHRAAATALIARLARLTDVGEGRCCPPHAAAHGLACAAELARLDGRPAARRWQRTAAAWERLERPYPAAYARLRQAEAILLHGGRWVAAQAALSAARDAARSLQATFLLAEAGRLAKGASLPPRPPLR